MREESAAMDDIENNLSDQERKYVEIYEHISHEVGEKRSPELIVRELMQEGYTEADARQWVRGVTGELRQRMFWRSAFLIVPGLILVVLGFVLLGTASFGIFLPGLGIVLLLWGLVIAAKYA
jgi:hypothetical protein